MSENKKGITVKVDADLHAEVKEYLEQKGMTMAEFVEQALQDELHPKNQLGEENNMEKMRTMAFQVPESLFQRIKDYLERNHISQKQFVLGLVEKELDREQAEIEENSQGDEAVEEEDEEEAESENLGDCDGEEDEGEEEDETEDEELDTEEEIEETEGSPVMNGM